MAITYQEPLHRVMPLIREFHRITKGNFDLDEEAVRRETADLVESGNGICISYASKDGSETLGILGGRVIKWPIYMNRRSLMEWCFHVRDDLSTIQKGVVAFDLLKAWENWGEAMGATEFLMNMREGIGRMGPALLKRGYSQYETVYRKEVA